MVAIMIKAAIAAIAVSSLCRANQFLFV